MSAPFSCFVVNIFLRSTYYDNENGEFAVLITLNGGNLMNNNCLCSIFNDNWIWIIIIALILLCCGCN